MSVENGLPLFHGRNITALAFFAAATAVFTHTPIEWASFDPTNSLHVLMKTGVGYLLVFIGFLFLKFDNEVQDAQKADESVPYQEDMFGSVGMTSNDDD